MELTFNKVGDRYEAEFQVTGDFNLHIEAVLDGNVAVYQRTTDTGDYALVRDSRLYPVYGRVYDMDFTTAVYPKYIKVSCATQPTSGVVTFNA